MNIAVCGLGRAGGALVSRVDASEQDELSLAVCRKDSSSVGCDVGDVLRLSHVHAPVVSLEDAQVVLREREVEVLVDFSHQSFTRNLVDLCASAGCNLVICTTNHSDEDRAYFREKAEVCGMGIVYAPNLTVGINLLIGFARKLSRVLPSFDFAVVERHRRGKPPVSATACMIADAVEGHDVPIAYVRAGGYVGLHELTAAGENERVTLIHESFSRNAFADGALLASRFIAGRKGLYDMENVIGDLEGSAK